MNSILKMPSMLQRRRLGLRSKLILGFSLIAAFASFITTAGIYTNLQRQVNDGFKNRLLGITRVAALQQNGDEFAQVTSAEDPLYESIRIRNTKILNSDPDLVFVYTMRKDENGIYFVVDAGDPANPDFSAYGDRYEEPSETLFKNFDVLKEAVVESDFYTDEFGTFLSAYAPIYASDGKQVGVIGVDISADTVTQTQRALLLQAITIFIIAVVLGIFFGYLAGNALARPVSKLTQGALAFASGKLDQRVKVQSGDEISDLADTFNGMAEEIQGLIGSLESRVAQRTRELEEQQKIIKHRSVQFESIIQVSKETTSARSLQESLPQVTKVISEKFGFYHVGIFLNDPANIYTVLVAANSEGGMKMLDRRHQLKIGEQGIVGYVTDTGVPRIALDVGDDSVYFNNPDLPLTHSEMALPIKTGNQIIGALDIQSTEHNAFTQDDIEVLGALADQVSLIIQNTRLLDQTRKLLSESEAIQRQYLKDSWSRLPGEQKLAGYKYTVAGAMPLDAAELEKEAAKYKVEVPITLRGEVIGALAVHIPTNEKVSQDQMDLLRAIADRVALSAENARLFDDANRRAEREKIITEITSKIGTSVRTESILKTAAQELNQILNGAEVLIKLGSEEKN
jgi:GAF domain-containing protein/HAMP domain-containing protein